MLSIPGCCASSRGILLFLHRSVLRDDRDNDHLPAFKALFATAAKTTDLLFRPAGRSAPSWKKSRSRREYALPLAARGSLLSFRPRSSVLVACFPPRIQANETGDQNRQKKLTPNPFDNGHTARYVGARYDIAVAERRQCYKTKIDRTE